MIYAIYPQIKINLKYRDTSTHSLQWHICSFTGLCMILGIYVSLELYLSSILVLVQVFMRGVIVYQTVKYRKA